ncbi:MAG: hypothetical protein RIR91_207 [Verrucomicrobiota bacterium]|jgi:hypothetical protein
MTPRKRRHYATRAEAEAAYARRLVQAKAARARHRLATGQKMQGNGPCWCCRMPAFGETEHRLCVLCLAA